MAKDVGSGSFAGMAFNIQRFSTHDGPGIRSTVFLKGCPLRCVWCQNPESFKREPELMFIKNKCILCSLCVSACPNMVHKITANEHKISWENCRLVGRCIDACCTGALMIVGRRMTSQEVLEHVKRDLLFYENSGGGVTVSGGEPMMQPIFTVELLRKCKESGIHTAVETCGYAKWSIIKSVLAYSDLTLYDIKHMFPKEHVRLTGVSNKLILQNVKRISRERYPLRVRIPIIPGYNDSVKNIEASATFISQLATVQGVDLLPYNRLAESKYERFGKEYALKGLNPPSPEKLEKLKGIIETYGLRVQIGG